MTQAPTLTRSEKILLDAIKAADKMRAHFIARRDMVAASLDDAKKEVALLEAELSNMQSLSQKAIDEIAEFEAAIKTIKAADQRRRIYGQEVVR